MRGPLRYWLATRRAITGFAAFGEDSTGGWRVEMDYRKLKEELGLDITKAGLAGLASSRNAREHGVCLFTQ